MTVAVFGSINLDVTAYLDRLPKPGETRYGASYKLGLGGKGANQAVAARRLGSEVRLIGRTGTDALADTALAELQGHGLALDLIRRDREPGTGIAIINVGEGGENTISLIGGGNLAVGSDDVERGRAALEDARVLLLQLEVPLAASLAAARLVRGHGGLAILDPAPAPRVAFTREELQSFDIVTPNEGETETLIGQRPATLEDALAAARELRARGARTAVVKVGAKGSAVSGPDVEAMIPAFNVEAIDTVAAGDTFNGGLAHGLERGMALVDAVRFASACAALSTTKRGAASAAPSRSEVDAFLARN